MLECAAVSSFNRLYANIDSPSPLHPVPLPLVARILPSVTPCTPYIRPPFHRSATFTRSLARSSGAVGRYRHQFNGPARAAAAGASVGEGRRFVAAAALALHDLGPAQVRGRGAGRPAPASSVKVTVGPVVGRTAPIRRSPSRTRRGRPWGRSQQGHVPVEKQQKIKSHTQGLHSSRSSRAGTPPHTERGKVGGWVGRFGWWVW